jgi:ubiquinone/menaquinone biosynthesis C-methylase UbiE
MQSPTKVGEWRALLQDVEDFKALARRTAKQILPQSSVLEVAPGPGYFAIELAKLGDYQITGLDISETFVEIARANAAKANVGIDFRRGNASGMPFDNDTFDFLLCRAAFKNFSEPKRALEEMHRVLRPGGQALIIDLRRDASKESINQAINDMNLSTINGIITKEVIRDRRALLRRSVPSNSSGAVTPTTLSHPRKTRRGWHGVIYEAEHTNLGRHVALKFLPRELAKDP